jgi:glycerol-3-phosphate acyltransferase PlsY
MALTAVVSYLIGSANFAIIICRLLYHKDIRDYGSGNAGMTNVARTFGKVPAVLVTIGDFCKGALAMLAGHLLSSLFGIDFPFYGAYIVAICVMLGHCFPVFYGFKGGKGILVSAGVILIINPLILLILLAIFLAVFLSTKIVSLGSITVAAMYPVLTLIFGLVRQSATVVGDTLTALLIGGFVIFLHRSNIQRLLNGTENRFGKKK